MSVELRDGRPEDAAACGRICHDAFEAISDQHNFPKDFPSPEVAAEVTGMMISHPGPSVRWLSTHTFRNGL